MKDSSNSKTFDLKEIDQTLHKIFINVSAKTMS